MRKTTTILHTNGPGSCLKSLKVFAVTLCCLFGSTVLFAQSDCPTITNTAQTSVAVCSGAPVGSLQVKTTAGQPYKIEFVQFDVFQPNPYKGTGGVHLGELDPENGLATMNGAVFPTNDGPSDKTYYVYGCLKPEPADTTCRPFALITVVIKPAATATLLAQEATCNGAVSAADGQVRIVGFAPTDTYEVSTSGQFTDKSSPVPADGLAVRNRTRTGTAETYRVRIYSDFGCYVERTATLTNTSCAACPPAACIPFTIVKTRSRRIPQ